MTISRRWPNNAKAAREKSLMHAALIERLIEPLTMGAQLPEAEKARRYGLIEAAALKIQNELQKVG